MNATLLLRALSDCAALLRSIGDDFWSAKMEAVIARQSELTIYDVRHVLGWFGGMGSLNDFFIHPANGDPVSPEQAKALNERLDALTTVIYEQANEIWREREQ